MKFLFRIVKPNKDNSPNLTYVSLFELAKELQDCSVEEFSLIEQFTGIYDICGVEIYEGDIVEFTYTKGFSETVFTKISQVVFKDGCFGFFEYKNEEDEYFNRDDLLETKVIGNIHENLEILSQ